MLDHKLLIIPLRNGQPDFRHATRIANNGPFWSFAATRENENLVIAAGGIEDRPLSRASGEFGYLDSFLYLFKLGRDAAGRYVWHDKHREKPERFMAVNLSAHNVLTPKALSLSPGPQGTLDLWVSGYGGDTLLKLRLGGGRADSPRKLRMTPGISDFVLVPGPESSAIVFANPLLDLVAAHELDSGEALHTFKPLSHGSQPRSPQSLVGESLFYTYLMAPRNSSDGELSRFTCEACHFEGGIDDRVHYTGRGSIHATTKPLGGLANNVPLFSRGGDDTLASMVAAEFGVANQERKNTFSIQASEHPWTSKAPQWPPLVAPVELRKALLAFFMDFNPAPNPWRIRQPGLDETARRGLGVFRERCSDCHQAVQSTRTEGGIPFDQWEAWLTDPDRDLIWGAPFFSRVGIEPYVDPAGARVPSLRRVWLKYPLFTNGSSPTVRHLLSRFRYRGSTVWHHLDPDDTKGMQGIQPLTPGEISALEALLRYF